MATFKFKAVGRKGQRVYTLPGVKGQLILRGLLAEGVEAPAEIEINFDGFAPADEKVLARQEKRENRASKAVERAQKAVERARKAAERAEKAKALAAKLGVEVPEPTTEAAPEGAEQPFEEAQQDAQ